MFILSTPPIAPLYLQYLNEIREREQKYTEDTFNYELYKKDEQIKKLIDENTNLRAEIGFLKQELK